MITTTERVGFVIQNGDRYFSGDLDCKGRSLADPGDWSAEPEEATAMRREIADLIVSRAPAPYREKLSVKKLTTIVIAVTEEAE